jgi:hypothetical protein
VTLNYVGVLLAASGTIFYLFVKTEATTKLPSSEIKKYETSTSANSSLPINTNSSIDEYSSKLDLPLIENEGEGDFFERQKESTKRIIGIGLSVLSGFLYGQSNTPVLYTNQKYNK